MNDLNLALIAIGILAGLIVGWVSRGFLASKIPTEKTLALRALSKAIEWVARINTVTPAQALAARAEADRETALIDAAKDAVGKL